MGLKNLLANLKSTYHRKRFPSHDPRPPAYSLHADDVITSWGANPLTGLRDFEPPSNITTRYTSSQSQHQQWVQEQQAWRLLPARTTDQTKPPSRSTRISTVAPSQGQTSNAPLEMFLFFAIYIILRALPAIRALKEHSTSRFTQMTAIVDIACAATYLLFLGQVIGAVCQLLLNILGLASWIANPMVFGGMGMLLWFVHEAK